MSLLPLWVDRVGWDAPVSSEAFVEADVLAEQVHNADARDTGRFLMMFVSALADERETPAGCPRPALTMLPKPSHGRDARPNCARRRPPDHLRHVSYRV